MKLKSVVFIFTKKYMEIVRVSVRIFHLWKYVIIVRLKKNYKANTIAPYISVVGGTQAPILDTTYHGWRLKLLLVRQFSLKKIYWAVGRKEHHYCQDEVL